MALSVDQPGAGGWREHRSKQHQTGSRQAGSGNALEERWVASRRRQPAPQGPLRRVLSPRAGPSTGLGLSWAEGPQDVGPRRLLLRALGLLTRLPKAAAWAKEGREAQGEWPRPEAAGPVATHQPLPGRPL